LLPKNQPEMRSAKEKKKKREKKGSRSSSIESVSSIFLLNEVEEVKGGEEGKRGANRTWKKKKKVPCAAFIIAQLRDLNPSSYIARRLRGNKKKRGRRTTPLFRSQPFLEPKKEREKESGFPPDCAVISPAMKARRKRKERKRRNATRGCRAKRLSGGREREAVMGFASLRAHSPLPHKCAQRRREKERCG